MRAGSRERPVWFQTAHHRQPPDGTVVQITVIGECCLRADRDRHIKGPADFEAGKTRRRDANDVHWMVVQRDLAADRGSGSAELALPKVITDYGAWSPAAAAVVRR